MRLEIAGTRDGRILGMRGKALSTSALISAPTARWRAQRGAVLSGPYRIDNIDIDLALLVTNKTPVGTYRGPGRFESDFFRERLFDLVAQDLGIDRVEFRRRNLVPHAEMPFRSPPLRRSEQSDEFDSGDNLATLDALPRRVRLAGKSEARRQADRRALSRRSAIGCFIEGGAAGPSETPASCSRRTAAIRSTSGRRRRPGRRDVIAQISADALEVPIDRIYGVLHGSTSYVTTASAPIIPARR